MLPDQEPDAVQDVAFEVDQVKVVGFPTRTESGLADIDTLAGGVGGGVGSEEPPPPPPHAVSTATDVNMIIFLKSENINLS